MSIDCDVCGQRCSCEHYLEGWRKSCPCNGCPLKTDEGYNRAKAIFQHQRKRQAQNAGRPPR